MDKLKSLSPENNLNLELTHALIQFSIMSKKRPSAHVIGDIAIDKIKSFLPKEWVLRSLSPDYGIDLLVEIFDTIDEKEKTCETLGEFLFIQVKGSQNLKRNSFRIHPVYNVAKSKWIEDKREFMDINVINYPIDVSLLQTVKRIGISTCVLLFLVDILTNELFFICLNDVIDKYIQPKNPTYFNQRTITLPIPVSNKINYDSKSLIPLLLYGKRSKLYSAFVTIRYQLKEMRREINTPTGLVFDSNLKKDEILEFLTKQLSDFILFCADQLFQLDIWSISVHLHALEICRLNVQNVVTLIKEKKLIDYHSLIDASMQTWEQLDNLGSMYEEIFREWFLPKFIGQLGSHENTPEIKTT